MDHILEAIKQSEPDEILCDALTDEVMTLYADAIIAGQDTLGTEFAHVRQHLRHCPDCAAEVEDIVEMLRLVQADELMAIAGAPVIPPWVTALFAQGRAWVQDQLLWINFALQQPLTTGGHPAIVTKSNQDQAPLRWFTLGLDELEDMEVDIRAEEEGTHCTLHVDVQIPSRWPDGSGITVILVDGEQTVTTQTDNRGQARFDQISHDVLDRLNVVVDPHGAG